eukprot:m.1177119 g.1177119  ORF g.1177119 m.1177119 type:complete len:402 (+) comp24521_c0_seq128:540-1745(+)
MQINETITICSLDMRDATAIDRLQKILLRNGDYARKHRLLLRDSTTSSRSFRVRTKDMHVPRVATPTSPVVAALSPVTVSNTSSRPSVGSGAVGCGSNSTQSPRSNSEPVKAAKKPPPVARKPSKDRGIAVSKGSTPMCSEVPATTQQASTTIEPSAKGSESRAVAQHVTPQQDSASQHEQHEQHANTSDAVDVLKTPASADRMFPDDDALFAAAELELELASDANLLGSLLGTTSTEPPDEVQTPSDCPIVEPTGETDTVVDAVDLTSESTPPSSMNSTHSPAVVLPSSETSKGVDDEIADTMDLESSDTISMVGTRPTSTTGVTLPYDLATSSPARKESIKERLARRRAERCAMKHRGNCFNHTHANFSYMMTGTYLSSTSNSSQPTAPVYTKLPLVTS